MNIQTKVRYLWYNQFEKYQHIQPSARHDLCYRFPVNNSLIWEGDHFIMKPYYFVCLENIHHGIAFFFTKEVPFTDEWDVVGKRV